MNIDSLRVALRSRVTIGTLFVLAGLAFSSDSEAKDSADTKMSGADRMKLLEVPKPNGNGREIEEPFLFGDGNWENISWRGFDSQETPEFPFRPQISALYGRVATGDSDAAWVLHRMLETCRTAPLSQDELDSRLNLLRSTGEIELRGKVELIDPADSVKVEKAAAYLSFMHDNCGSLTQAQISESDHLLEAAANGGPVEAIIFFSAKQDSAKAIPLLERAWSVGSTDALLKLSRHQLATYHGGSDPFANVTAYENLYAYATLMEQLTLTYGLASRQYLEALVREQESISSTMTPMEVYEATVRALEKIRNNQNCCFAR